MRSVYTMLLVLLLDVSGISQEGVPTESVFAPHVSVMHVVSKPEQYDGKRVQVFGYLHVRSEDSALYLSKDDADYLIGANAVWASYAPARKLEPIDGKEITGGTINDLKYFDGRYIMLEGFFNMNERGHMGSFSGSLERIARVLELRRWYDGSKELVRFDKSGRVVPERRRK